MNDNHLASQSIDNDIIPDNFDSEVYEIDMEMTSQKWTQFMRLRKQHVNTVNYQATTIMIIPV